MRVQAKSFYLKKKELIFKSYFKSFLVDFNFSAINNQLSTIVFCNFVKYTHYFEFQEVTFKI